MADKVAQALYLLLFGRPLDLPPVALLDALMMSDPPEDDLFKVYVLEAPPELKVPDELFRPPRLKPYEVVRQRINRKKHWLQK